MRKLIVSMNVTLDGFMAGPNCELNWHFNYWNEEMAAYASVQLSDADTILLGRITYTAMAKYWPSVHTDLLYSREDLAFADMMNRYHKVVFSNTLVTTEWNNTSIIKGDLKTEVERLKNGPGKKILVFGSGKLVSSLVSEGLVDEYVLWIHPVILGEGKPSFKGIKEKLSPQIASVRKFSSGVVILHYKSISRSIKYKNINHGEVYISQ